MPYYVYILASGPNGTLYVGVTNDLTRRVHEHKMLRRQFIAKSALKKWTRQWKINLIEQHNPMWSDLYPSVANP